MITKTKEKRVLFIDLDGVCANFHKRVNEIEPGLDTHEYTDVNAEQVDAVCLANPHIFQQLDTIEGSIDAINKLWEHYDIYFLSTPMWILPESFGDKKIWIEKHFGSKVFKRLILTHRKDFCVGDILVDDRTKNGAGEFKGEHVHFGTEKFPNWEIVYNYLYSVKDEEPMIWTGWN